MLKAGTKAPEFSFKDAKRNTLNLFDFASKKVVLYFYPRDNTPGCTTEACGFRDAYDMILERGAVVIGVSPDTEKSHENFKAKFNLPFYLAADPDKTLIKKYEVWGEKSMYGKKYLGLIRSTYIIDEEGKISHVFPRVSPAKHIAEVLAALTGS